MASFWQGVFFQKHRLGTGDIINHIVIESKELIEKEDDDNTGREGRSYWLVTFGFKSGEGGYQFEYEADKDEVPDDALLIEAAVQEL